MSEADTAPEGADGPAGPEEEVPGTIRELIGSARILICAGSGGVGKTTTAAVLALEAAREGRRAVVVTIDPAKRLADALGLEELGNEPGGIDGDWDGELAALMLDTKSTFDELVAKYAADEDQVELILGNRFYRNISSALSATQEFMAMEKLYQLHEETDFDLIVVDTPPTRNALDFLDAPGTLTRFLDHPLYKVLMAPTRGIVRAVNFAAQTLRTFRNLTRLLVAEKASWHDVIRTTCYLRDIERDYDRFNEIRAMFMRSAGLDPLPASTAVQARICRSDLLVEIEAIAVIPRG